MATLHIKNLPAALYKKVQALLVRRRLNEPKQLSILELQGLGQEIWRGVDAAAHVQRERSSWD